MHLDSPTVASEVIAGDSLSVSEAAKQLRVSPAALWRWITMGVRNASNQRTHLEACRLGCRWFTSKAALARFVAAMSAATPAENSGQPPVVSTRGARSSFRERAIAEAKARLSAAGI